MLCLISSRLFHQDVTVFNFEILYQINYNNLKLITLSVDNLGEVTERKLI